MKRILLLLLASLFLSISAARGMQKNQFGRQLLPEFSFRPGYVNLNHGSFGSVPKSVLAEHKTFIDQAEAAPDLWFRAGQGYREIVDEVRSLLARYLNVTSTDDLVLVENTSSGVNAVFRSLKFNKGDKILITSTAYSMVKNLVRYLEQRDGIIVVEVPLVFPLTSDDDVIQPIARALAEHGNSIKLASFSHIDSVPGFILPIQQLIDMFKKSGIRVFVDGAHAIGQIPIDIGKLDPDYYVTNGHKWLYSPKGSAVLYVRKIYQSEVVPTVVSSEFSLNEFVNSFRYTGTRDYTPYTSIKAAFAFRDRFGDLEIQKYLHDLAWWTGNHLASKWDTRLIVPEHMVGSMIDIELPVASFEEAEILRTRLFEKYDTYFITHQLQGKVYTRLSAQIFLEQADFETFGDRLLGELKMMRKE